MSLFFEKEIVEENESIVIESVEDRDPYETYNSYHIEIQFKDPSSVCWDEEMYYSNLPDAIKNEITTNKNTPSSKFYVYTNMGCGKTKFIGVIDVVIKPSYTFSYEWKEKIFMTKDIIENAANNAMVGTNGNIFISGFMKRNTFIEDENEKDYVIHRDGFNDIFHYTKDGEKEHYNREDFLKEHKIISTFQYVEPLEYTKEYYQLIGHSHSIHEFYTKLIRSYNVQNSFEADMRFESVTPFTKELDKIKRDILCEYRMIKTKKNTNNLIIEEVNQTIQSLIDYPYRLEAMYSVKKSSGSENKLKIMEEQLKTIKEIIPTIT